MAVFKNGIFAVVDGQIINPTTNLTTSIPCGAFFQAAGVLNLTQRSAIYQLVSDLQGYSIWNKMLAIYPMVGQSNISSSFSYNLKDPNTFRGTFYGGWTFGSNGGTPDGSTGYMDTGFNPNIVSSIGPNDMSLSAYTNSDIGFNQTYIMAANSTAGGENETSIAPNYAGNFIGSVNDTVFNGSTGNSTSPGYYIANKNNSGNVLLYKNQTKVFTATNVSTSKTNTTMFLGARNQNGGANRWGSFSIQFSHLGQGLTDTEATNLYTAVQRFQTTLGRQV
jgi:hypothetical protein